MKNLLIATSLLTSSISMSALAENSFNLGVNLGSLNAELSVPGFRGSEDVFIGVAEFTAEGRFGRYFGLEGAVSTSFSDGEVDGGFFDVGLENGVAINLVGYIPLDYNFELYGKIGYASLEFEDSDGDTASADGVGFGIGALYKNGPHIFFTEIYIYEDGEYDDFFIDIEPSVGKIGYKYTFNY